MALSATNYVKFLRGTPTAYKNLLNKDKDTLYFISEEYATSGVLYLGDKMIGGSEGISGSLSLEDLEGILISETIEPDSLLVYDEGQQKWVNKTAADVLDIITDVFIGATATEDGDFGLVPVPKAGEHEFFLRGDGTWAAAPTTDISALEAQVKILIGENPEMSVMDIIAEALIPENAKEAMDSLTEISAWIQSHPDDAAAMNASITSVKNAVFDIVGPNGAVLTEGLVTKVANINSILNDTTNGEGVVTPGLITTVNNLGLEMTGVKTSILNIQNDIIELDQRLQWQELVS